jgi:hypothetical protein
VGCEKLAREMSVTRIYNGREEGREVENSWWWSDKDALEPHALLLFDIDLNVPPIDTSKDALQLMNINLY